MPTVNFYLKKPPVYTCSSHNKIATWKPSECPTCKKKLTIRKGTGPAPKGKLPPCQVYLQFKYSQNKLIYYFGQSVAPEKWDTKKQRVKSNKETTADGQYALNDLLKSLDTALTRGYRLETAKGGIPTVEKLRPYLNEITGQATGQTSKETLFGLFDRFISGEIKRKGHVKSKSTRQNYQTTKLHLVNFSKEKRYKLDFDTVNMDFFNKFSTYLEELGLKQNSRAKDIAIIKTVMKTARKLKYTSNDEFTDEDFSIPEVEVESVYLTEKEVINLFRFDMSANHKLEKVRDLFVFGCLVGLRYSDYSNIKPENIVTIDGEKFIKVVTQKTDQTVIIPAHPLVLEIFSKYQHNPNSLPDAISGQKFNEYIKDACKLAELKEKGRLASDPKLELWECISSHTARRSFATNLYLDGFPLHEIRKITGHKTEAAFNKYIKVTQLESAKRLSAHIKKTWSSKVMKVA